MELNKTFSSLVSKVTTEQINLNATLASTRMPRINTFIFFIYNIIVFTQFSIA